jgi:hypothetical protein
MAATPTDATTDSGVVGPRRRGKSKVPNFKYDGPVSVIRLELDASDKQLHRLLERHWNTVFRLRRALQRDAQHRCRALWAAHHERAADVKAVRDRLGLTRKGIEAAAKAHIENSGWMRPSDQSNRAHVTDEVGETVERHLFPDVSGAGTVRRGSGRGGLHPHPGRAPLPETKPVWETTAWSAPSTGIWAPIGPLLPASVTSAAAAAGLPGGSSILAQPARLPAPKKPLSGSWRQHAGALAVVFTGLPSGDLVLPVRLAQGAGQWTHLCHFLADPTVWHKIDLVRVRDRRAPGGWRFYAHLLVHQAGYQAPSTQARRTQIPTDRRDGVDANVSNLALASFPADRPEQLLIDQITCTAEQQLTAHKAARKAGARQRALDRSRRNTNSDQYGPSPRQQARAARRAAAGLSPKRVLNPGGPRHARADGVPLRGYRHDCISRRYNRVRADHAAESGRASQAKQARAQQMAARIVAAHGNVITVEDCRISTWARLWGTRIALFSPGMLVAALKRECAATGGQLYRAGTHFTALSQHCLCGARVPKSLSQRTHACPHCGLHGDRDVISAILAACVDIADPDDPRTARVDYRLAHALRRGWPPSKSGRAQSSGTSYQQYPLPDRPGPAATTRWPLLSKPHSATPEQTRPKVWTSRDQPENTAPQAVWRSMTHYGLTLRRWTARCRRGCRAR